MGKFQDLTGSIFGGLTVLSRTDDIIYPSHTRTKGQRLTAWFCKCKCGKTRTFSGVTLRGRNTISCGCEPLRLLKMIGRRYGRLVIKDQAIDLYRGKRRWICKCDCGNTTTILGSSLYRGATKSCGCLREERKLAPGTAEKHSCFSQAKIGATKRKLTFELSFEQFIKISESPCAYCGDLPNQVSVTKGYNGGWTKNGVDRIDNQLGYTTENCAPCCWPCNLSKWKRTAEEFISHAKRIAAHQSSIAVRLQGFQETIPEELEGGISDG